MINNDYILSRDVQRVSIRNFDNKGGYMTNKALSIFNQLKLMVWGLITCLVILKECLKTIFPANLMILSFYNLVKQGENKYDIEIALAGYNKKDIEIRFKEDGIELSIKSKRRRSKDV